MKLYDEHGEPVHANEVLDARRLPDCRICDGSGIEEIHTQRNRETGTWDYDERACWYCDGTGEAA